MPIVPKTGIYLSQDGTFSGSVWACLYFMIEMNMTGDWQENKKWIRSCCPHDVNDIIFHSIIMIKIMRVSCWIIWLVHVGECGSDISFARMSSRQIE